MPHRGYPHHYREPWSPRGHEYRRHEGTAWYGNQADGYRDIDLDHDLSAGAMRPTNYPDDGTFGTYDEMIGYRGRRYRSPYGPSRELYGGNGPFRRDSFDEDRGYAPWGGEPEPRRWSGRHWGGGMGYDVWRDDRGFSGRAPKGYRRSDERIAEELNDILTRHPDIDPSDIEVSVKDGEVTLRGTVADRRTRKMVESLAEDLPGVGHVQNDIRMAARNRADTAGEERESEKRRGSSGGSARR